jgi:hypothetical protein
MQAAQSSPRLFADRLEVAREDRSELLGDDVGLARRVDHLAHDLAQVNEQFDVEGGVHEPRLGERPRGPVRRGVFLGEVDAE